ncbi:INO80 complex subunit D [Hippocampus zosterae]|uniref:INO80 complex subunit D n=1 Tax=Hippocampus zosterae TaxID=109293 RepID=UPI00223E8A42|nr:INO80 complex subunit D [Hippocampus zosterae]XP_051937606.1 INO80 complex subunit D [Hippocampus zosterae]
MYEGKHIHFSEVDNKPLCSYSPKLCKQRRLNGYAFCIRHVLEDKTAPFKQCEYVAKYNSQRCTNPIPKSEDRRYCNSHLQVLGFIPKKERKKKHDALEEMRSRAHLESVALNITVPSLPLASNGLNELPPSPPCTRLLALPDGEFLDPFTFYEDDTDGEEMGPPRKSNAIKKKLQSRLVLNQKICQDADRFQTPSEHFSPSLVPRVHPPSPLNTHPARQQSGLVQPPSQQGLLCNPAPPQTVNFMPPGIAVNASASPAQPPGPSLSRKTPFASNHMVVMRPASYSPPPHCLARLQHLVQLCAKRHREYGDLFPHLGLDWSEDSADNDDEDEEVEAERFVPGLSTWRPHNGLEDDAGSSRRTRLLRLCAYLEQKYKHMCRQERASIRQKRYRYAFRKALVHAATKNPDCAGQLIQELRGSFQSPSSAGSELHHGGAPAGQQKTDAGTCTGSTKGQACDNKALPFTKHCFQHILLNRSQQLFASCTAKFADGQQCSIPVFDITHQTPLCEEHAKKMDNFLRGDGNRRVHHHQHQHHHHHHQQQHQRKPRKKTKPPALTKKHKKKRRVPRRPQKPVPPALPQGYLGMPTMNLALSSQASIRSPSTPELSTDELPDDITNEMEDIPNDLELNQEDFSDVLPRLPDDLQDFDLFEGKNGELLPTTEEAEELVRTLQALGSYPDSLVCLTSIGDLAPSEGVDHRALTVFPGAVQPGAMGDILHSRFPTENFPSLELEDNILQSAAGHFPPSPPSQPTDLPQTSSANSVHPPSGALLTQPPERTFARSRPPAHILAKSDGAVTSSPQGGCFSGEHVASPYSDQIPSPHAGPFQTDAPLLLEPPRSSWNNLPLPLADPAQFGNLMASESHLISTSLSTPPAGSHSVNSVTLQPLAALSALPHSGLTGLTAPPAPPSSSPHDPLTSLQPKQQLPQFSAAFGHQLASHSGIPNDLQPSHSSTAPPAGFSIVSATTASANSASAPFTQSN